MLQSMTGFGSAAGSGEGRTVKVEIRTVNHRYLDVNVRLPRGFQALEERVRRLAGDVLERGRVEIFLSIEEYGDIGRTVRLDRGLLQGYLNALREAGELVGAPLLPSAELLLSLPDVLVVAEPDYDAESLWPLVRCVVEDALQQVVMMRRSEGERLTADIRARMARVARWVDEIAALAPQTLVRYRQRLVGQLQQLLGEAGVDEQRVVQEAALYADKVNIDEELTRARSHIEQFLAACESDGSVGRRLDFLIQEIQRELNTMAAKAQDAQVSALIVDAKVELEKVREQVQNVR